MCYTIIKKQLIKLNDLFNISISYLKLQLSSISNKIFYFSFCMSLSIILLIIFIAYFLSYNTIKDTSINREKNSLELISNQTDIILNSTESHVTNLIVNNDIQNILIDCSKNNIFPDKESELLIKREIGQIMYKNSIISEIIIHSTNGFKFQTNRKFISLVNVDNSDTLEFNKWHGAIQDIEYNHYLYIPKKIFDMNTGGLIGYLEIFIDDEIILKNYLDKKSDHTSSDFFLVNEKAIIVSSSNNKGIHKDIHTVDSNIQFADRTTPFKIIHNKKQNKIALILYQNKLNWNIIADIYLKDIIYKKKNLVFSLIILSFVSLICSFILSKIISKTITKPIINLYEAIDKIEKGNWATEIKIIHYDEIGVLSQKFNDLIKFIKNLLLKINYEQDKKKEFELELIQLQIKPHFLYNSLENISALVELEQNSEAVDMIYNLSTFYRGILNKGSNVIPIKEELSVTESYLKIMKLRYYDIFDYEISFDESIEDYYCLKLLIQPLVENSIYHGLKNRIDKGKILISISKLKDYIMFIIQDTGIGMDKQKLYQIISGNISHSSKSGFAINNTIERLNLYYPNNNTFHIDSQENIGTKITITIPAIRKDLTYYENTFS